MTSPSDFRQITGHTDAVSVNVGTEKRGDKGSVLAEVNLVYADVIDCTGASIPEHPGSISNDVGAGNLRLID